MNHRDRCTLVMSTAAVAALVCGYLFKRRIKANTAESKPPSPLVFVVPRAAHDAIVYAAFRSRGWDEEEARCATDLCSEASWHGISSHNFIKALDIDDKLGWGRKDGEPGCLPGKRWRVLPSTFKAVQRWDASKCSGFLVARAAVDEAITLAEEFGVGVVAVDNAFHYLWGAGWALRASRKGYICFTTCTGALPEVVPHGGCSPSMGTNPWTWALPTASTAIGFDFVFDWATSVVSNGTVKKLARQGQPCPQGACYDARGEATTDPHAAVAHATFGAHKGFGLCALTELLAAYGGAGLPTLRGCPTPRVWPHPAPAQEKSVNFFYFQVIHPKALEGASFGSGRTQEENVAAVAADVLGHGNSWGSGSPKAGGGAAGGGGGARLPGSGVHAAAQRSTRAGGLLLSESEVSALKALHGALLLRRPAEEPQSKAGDLRSCDAEFPIAFPDTPRWCEN